MSKSSIAAGFSRYSQRCCCAPSSMAHTSLKKKKNCRHCSWFYGPSA